MAFVLFATVLYLLNILGGSLGSQAVVWAMAFLLAVAFALWLWGRLVSVGKKPQMLAGLVLGPALILAAGYFTLPRIQPPQAASSEHLLAWEDFDRDALLAHLAEGRTVLIDFTADWCPNCKTNEAIALNVPETVELVDELGVVTMMADWTAKQNPDEIGTMLRSLGYSSIPLTAIFPAGDPESPILLDGLYSAARLHEELRNASGLAGAGEAEAEVISHK
jgi:thiol:disulfide interchange protein